MCGFWDSKKPLKYNSAERAFSKKLQQAHDIELEAYEEYFKQYTKLLNETVASIKQFIEGKHKGTPYTALLEEIYNLAEVSIQRREYSLNVMVYDHERKYDLELYNDLLALNEVLKTPSPENMAFLSERAKNSWFGFSAEHWKTIGLVTLGLGIGVLILATAASFVMLFTTSLILSLLVETAGGFGAISLVSIGSYLHVRDTNLLQIEYNLHDFADLYQQQNVELETSVDRSVISI